MTSWVKKKRWWEGSIGTGRGLTRRGRRARTKRQEEMDCVVGIKGREGEGRGKGRNNGKTSERGMRQLIYEEKWKVGRDGKAGKEEESQR